MLKNPNDFERALLPHLDAAYNLARWLSHRDHDAQDIVQESCLRAFKAFDRFRGEELSPGPAVQTDAEIDAHIRANAETAYHPSCTCRMGNDPMAVTDGQGRVHGVANLRVVDASIMPDVVSGNLNAPTIMMAEKIADTILGRVALAASAAPTFVHPQFDTQQR